jgi:hypothetical protein
VLLRQVDYALESVLHLCGVRRSYLLLIGTCLLVTSCSGSQDQNANSANARDPNRNANSTSSTPTAGRFALGESDRYRLLFELAESEQAPSSPESASNRNAVEAKAPRSTKSPAVTRIVNPTEVTNNQFELDKVGNDRRWSFQVPALGSVVYLEKSGLKYLVLYDRKKYLEVSPADLGFDAGKMLNPLTAAVALARKSEPEGLGLDQVAGRNAFKFRFAPSSDGSSPDRVVGIITVDQETGLPTRFELSEMQGQSLRNKSSLEAREVKLSVSASLFDVPVGMTKIKASEAKPQIQQFSASVRRFVDALNPPLLQKKEAPTAANAATNANRSTKSNNAANANKSPHPTKNSRSRNKAILSR